LLNNEIISWRNDPNAIEKCLISVGDEQAMPVSLPNHQASDGVLAGADIPGKMNPYAQFRTVQPTAVIDRGVYVYEGTFNLGSAAALEHVEAFGKFMREKRFTEALGEAETATNLDPASAIAWKAVGDALEALNRSAEAPAAYQNALHAQELDPVFQKGLKEELQKKLSQ
jgi:tetratricopeptide (TPR) repeat protein